MRTAIVLLLLALAGCVKPPAPVASSSGQVPAPPVPDAPSDHRVGPDLSHVKAGQRYTFHLDQAGSQMDMVWEVRAVAPDRVDYAVSMVKNGTVLGDPGETSWSIPNPPPPAPHSHDDEDAPPTPRRGQVSYEEIQLGGRTWRARLTVSEGTRTWTAVSGEVDTFPPLLKHEKDGVVTSVLTKVEEPR